MLKISIIFQFFPLLGSVMHLLSVCIVNKRILEPCLIVRSWNIVQASFFLDMF